MQEESQSSEKWWGQFEIPKHSSATWQIESLSFAIHHMEKEWLLSYEREHLDDSLVNKVQFTLGDADIEHFETATRHVFKQSSSLLELRPQLADRTVVTRPVTPISLAPGEEITLYISTPLWVQFEMANKNDSMMSEFAINRPSDTWFGRTPREGELCYASQTSGRVNLENIPLRPSRAITPLNVINHANDKLLLERVALPVPLLSLFGTPEGLLWTQPVTLIRDNDGDMAELKLGKYPPKEANNAVKVNNPRQQAVKGMLVRAFSSIFEKGI